VLKGSNEDACSRIRHFGYAWSSCGEYIGYNATPNGVFHEIGIGAFTRDYGDFNPPYVRWTLVPLLTEVRLAPIIKKL